MPEAPDDVHVLHPTHHTGGVIHSMIHGFQELPGWGKITLGVAVVGAGVLGYVAYKNSQAASNATNPGSSTSPGSWFGNGQASSSGAGTTSGTAPDTGSTPNQDATTSGTPAVPVTPSVPAAIAQAPAATPSGSSYSAYASPAISAAATSVGASRPVYTPTLPTINSAGLAESTGTVGVPTVNAVGQTVKVPANVTSSAAASGANGGPATYATTSHYTPPTVAPAAVHNYVNYVQASSPVYNPPAVPKVAQALSSRLGRGGAYPTYRTHTLARHPLQSATMYNRRSAFGR